MSRRTERVSALLREEIGKLLLENLHDPRLGRVVTVTNVNVSPDLRLASVRISALGNADEQRDVKRALESATGFLRTELAKRLQLKHAPELKIEMDESIEEGDRVLALLDSLKPSEPPIDQETPDNG
jgi:ribosome-binding factor A